MVQATVPPCVTHCAADGEERDESRNRDGFAPREAHVGHLSGAVLPRPLLDGAVGDVICLTGAGHRMHDGVRDVGRVVNGGRPSHDQSGAATHAEYFDNQEPEPDPLGELLLVASPGEGCGGYQFPSLERQ